MRPYSSGEIPGSARDFSIEHGSVAGVLARRSLEILDTYLDPSGQPVLLVGESEPREINYLAFQFGSWAVLVYDYAPLGAGPQMTPLEHQTWVDSLSGETTEDGFLILRGSAPLTLARAGEHAGPSMTLSVAAGWIQLIPGVCDPQANTPYEGGDFDSWCATSGIMAVHVSESDDFVGVVRAGLTVEQPIPQGG